jgi:DNA-binding CsgD family transcriptional regulator
MAKIADGKLTTLAAGMLSLDYLNSLFSDYADFGELVAVASQMPWQMLDSGSGLQQVAAAANLIASVYAAYALPLGAAVDRANGTRRGPKKSVAAGQSNELSGREKTCLSWTARGKSSWETGRILCISENTVIFHIKNAMRKLGTNSRTLAAFKAVQLGLIEAAVEPEPQAARPASGP